MGELKSLRLSHRHVLNSHFFQTGKISSGMRQKSKSSVKEMCSKINWESFVLLCPYINCWQLRKPSMCIRGFIIPNQVMWCFSILKTTLSIVVNLQRALYCSLYPFYSRNSPDWRLGKTVTVEKSDIVFVHPIFDWIWVNTFRGQTMLFHK